MLETLQLTKKFNGHVAVNKLDLRIAPGEVFALLGPNGAGKDGWGKLYLNGEYQGQFTGWENTFHWDVSQSAVTLGLSYIGWFGDLALFNRPLTDAEVKAIHQAPGGVREVVK